MTKQGARIYFMLMGGLVFPPTPPVDDPCADFTRIAPTGQTLTVAETITNIAPTGQTLHICREVI